MDAARDARRRLPVGAQHRPAATPVAHHDQDRQGRQAQQARPRSVRRDPSRRRRRAGHRRRPAGRARVAARPRGAARGGHRPGPAGQLLCAVPLERRARRVPDHQRGHQRRRRPRLAAAGVQGVRGAAASPPTYGLPRRPGSTTTRSLPGRVLRVDEGRRVRCCRSVPCGRRRPACSQEDSRRRRAVARHGRWCSGRRRPATPRTSRPGGRLGAG